ncbi:MAG TPA: helix-turn-helix domain-containing protein [Verrucomicrobiae bacterium]|nr:helix-turn-helix domain-containing protein [Verrucomicrobiae bacterium]
MDIWQQLVKSDAVRRQQVAFSCATGLPLTLLPASGSGKPGTPLSSLFCIDGCMGPGSGELCQQRLLTAERKAAGTGRAAHCQCPAGLIKLVTPVVIGGRHVGNLLAGPFSLGTLDAVQLRRLTGQLKKWGLQSRVNALQASWHASPSLDTKKLHAVETLLEMFAQYLAECGQRLLLEEAGQRSPLLQKIEAYFAEQGDRATTVRELADRLHISPCHFCKLFKRQTGLTFTEYRTQLRIEAAKKLLLNRHLRVSEVAFEAGFDSIPYFNRAFRRQVGCSPSEFRARRGLSIRVKK